MLSDHELEEIGKTHIRRYGDELELSRPVVIDNPPGLFYRVVRPSSSRSTNLVGPFFVWREDGKVVSIAPGDVMPRAITKLYGWAAMRGDPELQRAVLDPDFDVPRHVQVWSEIVREVVTGEK